MVGCRATGGGIARLVCSRQHGFAGKEPTVELGGPQNKSVLAPADHIYAKAYELYNASELSGLAATRRVHA